MDSGLDSPTLDTPDATRQHNEPSSTSNLLQKTTSACFGAILTSLVVTPFDVVKTRLQSGTVYAGGNPLSIPPLPASSPYRQIHECCREVFFGNEVVCRFHGQLALEGCAAVPTVSSTSMATTASSRFVPRTFPAASVESAVPASARMFTGTLDGMIKIMRYEGIASLWSGLSPTLVMQVPATVGYYLGYEVIRDTILTKFHSHENIEHYAPLIAGSMARTVAATTISPIELVRTRVQSGVADSSLRNVLAGVRQMVATQGIHKLWTGLAPTLWRDVPFSAIYWYGYELTKRRLDQRYPNIMGEAWGAYWVSFLAGAASGTVAAVVTTPFDVAKTRNQISTSDASMKLLDLMKTIVKEDGWMGLMSGWTARVAKVAPSCAIMISTYELGKRLTSPS